MSSPDLPLTNKLHRNNQEHQLNQIVIHLAGSSGIFWTLELNKKRLTNQYRQIAFQKSMELRKNYTNENKVFMFDTVCGLVYSYWLPKEVIN